MFIKQTEQELRHSLILNANIALEAVRLSEGTLWSSSVEQFGAAGDVETEVRYWPGATRREGRSLIMVIAFKFTARSIVGESSKAQDLIKVGCKFEAEYELRPDFEPAEDQIKAFHKGNAIFNCWPYFREFVQNGTVRMHMPPPPVPLLRMLPPDKSPKAVAVRGSVARKK